MNTTVIFGATGGIGASMVQKCAHNAHILCPVREGSDRTVLNQFIAKGLNITIIEERLTPDAPLMNTIQALAKYSHIDRLFSCVGFLHNSTIKPERALKSLSYESFIESITTNAYLNIQWISQLSPYFANDAIIAVLSAKLGSISDNQLGGWHSYRAAKAALNMLLQGAFIELRRKNKNIEIFSVHPGTTKTQLSEPFIGRTKLTVHTPEASAENILKSIAIHTQSRGESARFISWDGSILPW